MLPILFLISDTCHYRGHTESQYVKVVVKCPYEANYSHDGKHDTEHKL